MEFEFVFKEIKPPKYIQTKINHVNHIISEINIVIPKNYNLFKVELQILRNEFIKYLKLVDDPLDEIIRLLYSTIPQTVHKFNKESNFKKIFCNKELFGDFYKDDEEYGLIGVIIFIFYIILFYNLLFFFLIRTYMNIMKKNTM